MQHRSMREWISRSILGMSVWFLFMGFSGPAHAQEGEGESNLVRSEEKPKRKRLKEVTVTATRTEEEVDKAPASTTVVTEEEMERKHVPTLDEALRREVGVYVLKFRGPVDNHTTTIMRGFQGQQRTLLMLDGIPLNSVITGSVPWSELPVDEIERIELVRGPYSALYGGYALGGAVNSIMLVPKEEIIKARVGYGSFGTGNVHLQYGNRVYNDRLSFIIGFDHWWTDGYVVSTVERPRGNTPADGSDTVVAGFTPTTDVTGQQVLYTIGNTGDQKFDRDYLTGKLSFDLTSHSTLSLTALYGRWSLDQPTFTPYLRDPSGLPVVTGNVNIGGNRVTLSEQNYFPITREDEASLYALQYRLSMNPALSIQANVGYSMQFNQETEFRALPPALGLGTSRWTTRDRESDGLHTELLSHIQLGERNLLTAGILYQMTEGEQSIPVLFDRRVPLVLGLASVSGGKQQTQAIYLQDQITVLDNLAVYLGARYDRWENTDGFQELAPDPRTIFEDRSQNSFNPKVSIVYSPFTSTNLRASVGTAFRPPTLDELYVNSSHGGTQTIGNPDLKPEEIFAWEVGFVQQLPTETRIGVTYYKNRMEDLIFRRTISPAGAPLTVRTLENAAEGESKGIEVDANQRIASFLDFFANATWLDATITRNPGSPSLVGKTIPQIPDSIYNFGLDLHAPSFIGTLTYEMVGDAFTRDDNTDLVNGVRQGLDPFESLDAKIVYTGWEKVSTSVSVRNILDERPFQTFGRLPGRNWFAEMIVHF